MIDDQNSFDPHNAGWARFQFRIVHSPLLKRLKPAQRWRVMELMSLSMDWGNVGVISQYDDEIASTLGMTMGHWSALCDRLLLHCILRVVEMTEGRRVYEFNPQLLCRQKSDQRRPEAFRPETWLLPDAPPPMQGEDGEKEDGQLLPADLDPEERRQALSAARVAYFRARSKARKQSQPEPRRDEFVREYFSIRYGIGGEIGNAADGNAAGGNSVTPDGNGNAPQTTERKREERETNNSGTGNGNAPLSPQSVTEKSVTGTEADGDPRAVVVALINSGIGVSASTARGWAKRFPPEVIRQQLEWLPYRKHEGDKSSLAGMLFAAMGGKGGDPWEEPDIVRERRKRAEKRVIMARSPEAKPVPEQTPEQDERAELFALLSPLSPEEQAALTRQAEERLSLPLARQVERNRADGKPPGPVVQTALNGHLLTLLRERETQDAQAAAESLPHLDAFFEGGQPT